MKSIDHFYFLVYDVKRHTTLSKNWNFTKTVLFTTSYFKAFYSVGKRYHIVFTIRFAILTLYSSFFLRYFH